MDKLEMSAIRGDPLESQNYENYSTDQPKYLEQPPPYQRNPDTDTQLQQEYQTNVSGPIVTQPILPVCCPDQPLAVFPNLNKFQGPGYYYNPTSALEELRSHLRLIISTPGRVDESLCHVNIQDQNGGHLFSVQVQGGSRRVDTPRRGGTYKFHDHNGIEVFTAIQETSSMHVNMQGRALGTVQNNNAASTKFTASSLTDGSSFQIEGENQFGLRCFPCWTESDFYIKSNRGESGCMTCMITLDGKSLCMDFPPNTIPNCKAVLMSAGVMIFNEYFGKTIRGKNGTTGAARAGSCWCCCCCWCY